MILERLAVYSVLALVLGLLGLTWTTELFWCVMALVWVAEHLARLEGYDDAIEISQSILEKAHEMLREAKQLEAKGADNEQR